MRRIARLLLLGFVFVASIGATPTPKPGSSLWFDPTQLPSFTGTVERYLPAPGGGVDRLLFKEGPQIVFPPEVAEAVQHAAPVGHGLVVWGIRAREAPVITMLAYAASNDDSPTLLDKLYWRPAKLPAGRSQELSASGEVKAPYYTPQGEIAGAILTDGTVIEVAPDAAGKEKDRLQPGAKLAAEGRGISGPAGKALIADRIGDTAEALKPLAAADAPASAQPQK